MKNDELLRVKRFLLSFAQFSEVLLKTQDSGCKGTRLNFAFYDPKSIKIFTIIFFCVEVNFYFCRIFFLIYFTESAPSLICLQNIIIMESKRTLEVPERSLGGS